MIHPVSPDMIQIYARAPAARREKDGTAVLYLQLVHDEPATKSAKMRVLHNFDREDQVEKAGIKSRPGALSCLLDVGRATVVREPGRVCRGSVSFGGPRPLDRVRRWRGIGAIQASRFKTTRRIQASDEPRVSGDAMTSPRPTIRLNSSRPCSPSTH